MRFFKWLHLTRKPAPVAKPKRGLKCCECGVVIHRHDNYRVLAVVHKDCRDVRMVGQKSLMGISE